MCRSAWFTVRADSIPLCSLAVRGLTCFVDAGHWLVTLQHTTAVDSCAHACIPVGPYGI